VKPLRHFSIEIPPPVQQRFALKALKPFILKGADTLRLPPLEVVFDKGRKFLLVSQGKVRCKVPEVQMSEDIVDRPALELRFPVKIGAPDRAEQLLQPFALFEKILCLLYHPVATKEMPQRLPPQALNRIG
jgi:hypothetical protein